MKRSDKAIVFGVVVAVLAIGFYMMVLSPKRQKAGDLNNQIDQLHASISQQEQVASFAEQARRNFPRYYGRLVVLGKAVPEQADTASMLVQLNTIAGHTHVNFSSIELGTDASSAGSGSSSASTPTASAASNAPAGTSTTVDHAEHRLDRLDWVDERHHGRHVQHDLDDLRSPRAGDRVGRRLAADRRSRRARRSRHAPVHALVQGRVLRHRELHRGRRQPGSADPDRRARHSATGACSRSTGSR